MGGSFMGLICGYFGHPGADLSRWALAVLPL
jgi:hypothetical protein